MSNKNNSVYLQFPLPVFVEMFPDIANMLPPIFDFTDSNYIVRVDPYKGRIEIGYTEDAWIIE